MPKPKFYVIQRRSSLQAAISLRLHSPNHSIPAQGRESRNWVAEEFSYGKTLDLDSSSSFFPQMYLSRCTSDEKQVKQTGTADLKISREP